MRMLQRTPWRISGKYRRRRKCLNLRHWRENPYGARRNFPNANFTQVPLFPLSRGGFARKSRTCVGNLKRYVFAAIPSGRVPIYAHVAEDARADFWDMRIAPQVPGFSPFSRDSLVAFRNFDNANFTGPLFPPSIGGGHFPKAISVRFRLETVLIYGDS